MSVKRLSMFALASLLIIAVGAQSVSAYSWTSNGGIDCSRATSNTYAFWNEPYMVYQSIDVYKGLSYNWGNLFHNANSVDANIYEYYNGGLASAGMESGGLLAASTTLYSLPVRITITGYPWPDIPYDNYPSNMGLADTYYFVNGYSASTDWWYQQGVNGRK